MWALGRRSAHAAPRRNHFPAFARHVLHRAHAISRLLEIWRRIQSDGPRRLRPARIPRRISPHRLRGRAPLLPPRPRIFHAPDAGRGHDLARRRQNSRSRPPVFRRISKSASAPRAKPKSRSNSAIAISLPACKPRSKKCSSRIGPRSPQKPGQKSLCLAGGVAFNCVANGKIFDHSPFERVFVQPAAGDAGLSVGAAFAVNHQILGRPREFVMDHAVLGPCNFPRSRFAPPSRISPQSGRRSLQISELDEDPLARSHRAHTSPPEKLSAGFRAASNGVRARSAIAAFSPIRAARK